MSKRQNHRINKLTHRVSQLEMIVENIQNKIKDSKYNKKDDNHKIKKASTLETTTVCILGWWDLFLILQYLIPNKYNSFLLALITSITLIVPVFYQDKIKEITIKATEIWGLVLLIILIFILIFSIFIHLW